MSFLVRGFAYFAERIWEVRSDKVKKLIKKLLTLDPDNRISAVDAMADDWFTSKVST